MRMLTLLFGIVLAIPIVTAGNFTIDNTSPLVVYSPTPCYLAISTDCSSEWLLTETIDDFLGSSTTTTGPNVALGLTVVPRASLTFQGSSVVFVPGKHSTAAATVVVDNLTSILVNTSLSAFAGAGLDPFTNHTITITFVPSDKPTTLDVDYFMIEQPFVSNITSSSTAAATSTIVPTTMPTSLPSTTTPTSTSTSTQLPPANNTTQPAAQQSSGTPAGTIAGVSVSGAMLFLFAALTWFLAVRRRRRRTAYQREKAILYDLRLPSERNPKENAISRGLQPEREGDLEGGDPPRQGTDRREKGKGREKTWRESILPPVHYTPWR